MTYNMLHSRTRWQSLTQESTSVLHESLSLQWIVQANASNDIEVWEVLVRLIWRTTSPQHDVMLLDCSTLRRAYVFESRLVREFDIVILHIITLLYQ